MQFGTKWPTAVETARVSKLQRENAHHVIAAIADQYKVSTKEILGRDRLPRVVKARRDFIAKQPEATRDELKQRIKELWNQT